MTDPIRHSFDPATLEEAAHMLRAAAGAYCFVCRREPLPKHVTYKNLTVCGNHASIAPGRVLMNDVSEREAEAGMAGMDRAGEYLASIGKFDLRDLTDKELHQFNAHWLCGYSERMSEMAAECPPF